MKVTGRSKRRTRQYRRVKARMRIQRRRHRPRRRIQNLLLRMAEPKKLVTQVTDTALAAGTIVSASNVGAVVRGDSPANRNGDRIYARKLLIKGTIANIGTSFIFVRHIVFWTKANPTSDTLYYNPNSNTEITAAAWATLGGSTLLTIKPSTKYCTVIHDRIHKLQPNTAGSATDLGKVFQIKINLKNREIQYEGNLTGPDDQDWILCFVRIAYEPANLVAGQTGSVRYNYQQMFMFKDP